MTRPVADLLKQWNLEALVHISCLPGVGLCDCDLFWKVIETF